MAGGILPDHLRRFGRGLGFGLLAIGWLLALPGCAICELGGLITDKAER